MQFKAACASTLQPLLVFAGPGSGKTSFLSVRIAGLLANDCGDMACLTYTNKAARQMEKRVRDELANGGFHDLSIEERGCHISTIHSFCKKVITEHSELIFPQKLDRIEIVNCDPNHLAKVGETFDLAEQRDMEEERVQRLVEEAPRVEAVSKNILSKALRDPCWLAKQGKSVQDAVFNYQQRCRAMGMVDLAELVPLTLTILGTYLPAHKLLSWITEKYKYLFVDELQDCDSYELALFKLFDAAGAHVTAVGDDDQSIFDWRFDSQMKFSKIGDVQNISDGTVQQHQHNFFKLFRLFPNAQTCSFGENYRCPPPVMRVMKQLVDHNKKRI